MGEHPWAMHTFGAVVYDSARDEMIVPIFDEHLLPGRFTNLFRDLWPKVRCKPTWIYRFAKRQWVPLAGDGVNCLPYCATYDSDRQVVVGVMPDGIYELAGEPRAWRKVGKKGFFGWHTNCAYDCKNKAVVVFGSNGNRNDIAAYFPAAGEYRIMPTPGLRPPPDQHNPMEFCPDTGETVVLVDRVEGKREQTEVWLYDLAQDTRTQVPSATLPFACGMNYNLEYDPGHRCLLLVTGPLPSVWALRLEPPEKEYQASGLDFRLDAGSDAVDRGVMVANFSESFRGRAPDLGAYELGDGSPDYGPRPRCSLPAEDLCK